MKKLFAYDLKEIGHRLENSKMKNENRFYNCL